MLPLGYILQHKSIKKVKKKNPILKSTFIAFNIKYITNNECIKREEDE